MWHAYISLTNVELICTCEAALMVTPVLEAGWNNVSGIFPAGKWYDLNTGAELEALLPFQALITAVDPPVLVL